LALHVTHPALNEVSTSVRVFGVGLNLIGASIFESADPYWDVVDRLCHNVPLEGWLMAQSRSGAKRPGVDDATNVVGIDPHKLTLTATVADRRGGIVASEHFRVSGDGHRALEAWALQFGPVARWGIEGASSWGRHTAVFLIGRGHDVRDVCANRTPRSDRARQRGKSDRLDSERIARETLAYPRLPKAFKRAGGDRGPDELHELLTLRHNQRRSIHKSRQHLLNEAECLLCELLNSPAGLLGAVRQPVIPRRGPTRRGPPARDTAPCPSRRSRDRGI
jgi:transposase